MVDGVNRVELATLPTALERGPLLDAGVQLWVKRDDLTGLGMGGNKARKLEFLLGEALASGARSLVTVGASQSNHCRMTAAAGARLGLEVHLILAGDRPAAATGNQLLAELFGARLHFTGAAESHWGELEVAREELTTQLTADGAAPFPIPIGGSTPVGALGYAVGFEELMQQCDDVGIAPATIVHTSSSGGTHAGLLAGRAIRADAGGAVPEILAIGVAKGVNLGLPDVAELANETLALMGSTATVDAADVIVDPNWIGDDYAVPTAEGDAAIRHAARDGGWVMDRAYSGKGFAGLLGNATAGRWNAGDDVVFIHTGGAPSIFATGGAPA